MRLAGLILAFIVAGFGLYQYFASRGKADKVVRNPNGFPDSLEDAREKRIDKLKKNDASKEEQTSN